MTTQMSVVGALTGGGDGSGATTSSVTLTLPAGCQPGDVVVVSSVMNTGSNTATTPTGWTLLSGPDLAPGNVHTAYCWGRVLTSGDVTAGAVTVTWNGSGRILAEGLAIRDADPAAPFGPINVIAQGNTGTTLTLPTITTQQDGATVVTLVSTRIKTGGQVVNATLPPAWTVDDTSATAYGSGVNFVASAAHIAGAAAGTYGGGTVTLSPDAGSAAAYTLALKPAVAASTIYPVTGTASASTAVAGVVTAVLLAAGTVAGVSGSSGSATRVPRTYAASGVVAATSGTTGSVSVIGGPATLPASGTVTATTTTAGAATALLAATGTTAVVAGVVGDVTVIVAPVTHQAAGTVAATSGTSGAVTIWQPGQAPPDFTSPGALLKGNLATAMLTGNAAGAALAVNPAGATLHATTHNAVWRHPDMSKWKTGDTWPPLEITLTDAGQPVDLSTATAIAFHSAPKAPATITINAPMQPADPVNGVVRYLWQPGDLDEAGTFRAEAEVTWADGTIQTFPPDGYLSYTVADQLDAVTP